MELENKKINWAEIGKAFDFYQDLGYQYVEVPWLVDDEAIKVTFDGEYLKGLYPDLKDNAFVASAEQSFIALMIEQRIKPGRYVAATPCFRFSDIKSNIHQKYFFKIELIHIFDPGFQPNELQYNKHKKLCELEDCIASAEEFFIKKSTRFGFPIKREQQPDNSIDLTLNGIEIGSYGYRTFMNHHWIYGTGLAEPRFSSIVASAVAKYYRKKYF